jgi:hypothetical protein
MSAHVPTAFIVLGSIFNLVPPFESTSDGGFKVQNIKVLGRRTSSGTEIAFLAKA